MNLTKLFRSRPAPKPIADLDLQLAVITSDFAWGKELAHKALSIEKNAATALSELADSPSKLNAEAYVAACRALVDVTALRQSYETTKEKVAQLRADRMVPLLFDALESAITILESERAEILKRDADMAEEIGADLADVRSPIITKLDERLSLARRFLKVLDEPHASKKIETILRFIQIN